MLFKNIFLVILIKSGLLLIVAQQESDTNSSDLILFLQTPISFLNFFKIPTSNLTLLSNSNRIINIILNREIRINSIDYHPPTKTLFFTSPRVGYWSKNSRLYSIPWDPDFDCTEQGQRTKEKEKNDDDLVSDSDSDTDKNDSEKTAIKMEILNQFDIALSKKLVCMTDKEHNMNLILHKQTSSEFTKFIREEENWNTRSFAVDYIGNKIYIVDTGDVAVNVFDLDGQNKATVFRNESIIPLQLEIDVNRGLMFILAYKTKIGTMQVYRVNMDGSSPLLIAEHKEEIKDIHLRDKIGFALNTMKKRVYFPNHGKKMFESVDYDGNGRVMIGEADPPLSITAYNDTVFWSKGGTSLSDYFFCASKRCSIFACKIDDINGGCIENSTSEFYKGESSILTAYSIKSIVTHPKMNSNPCVIGNGGCEQHCLLKHSSFDDNLEHGCICKEGYRLTENLKNCTKIKVTNIYDHFYLPKSMKLTSLNNLSSEDIYPVSRNLVHRLKYKRPHSIFIQSPFLFLQVDENGEDIREKQFDVEDSLTSNPHQDYGLAFLSAGSVLQYRCRSSFDPRITHSTNGLARVLSYDWITKNVYYVKLSNRSTHLTKLMTFRFELPGRMCVKDQKSVLHYLSKYSVNIAKIPEPISMEIHPYKGYVFASLRNGSLIRLNTDGSNKVNFPNVNNSIMLAIDLSNDKVYFLDSEEYISYVNLDGTNLKRLFKNPANQTLTIEIFDDWIYVLEKTAQDWLGKDELKLWRFDKLTGKAAGVIERFDKDNTFYRESLGFKVSEKDAHFVNADDHPCAVSNGGCESICFAVPTEGTEALQKICACDSGQEFLEDDKSCELLNKQLEKEDETEEVENE